MHSRRHAQKGIRTRVRKHVQIQVPSVKACREEIEQLSNQPLRKVDKKAIKYCSM